MGVLAMPTGFWVQQDNTGGASMNWLTRLLRRFFFWLGHGSQKKRWDTARVVIGHCAKCECMISVRDELKCPSCYSKTVVVYGPTVPNRKSREVDDGERGKDRSQGEGSSG